MLQVIRDELAEVREAYGDERRTEIVQDHSDLSVEDLIPSEEVVVTLSHGGYAKAQPIDVYQAQKRGGRGRSATKVKDEDFIDNLFIANTHDTILCFSSRGKMYWLKVYQVPQASRGSRGKPIVNSVAAGRGERINAVCRFSDYDEDSFVFMATSGGTVKKTPLSQFSRPRANGIIAIDLRDDRWSMSRSPMATPRYCWSRVPAKAFDSLKKTFGRWVEAQPAFVASSCRPVTK